MKPTCWCNSPTSPHSHVQAYGFTDTSTYMGATDAYYHLFSILYKLGITVLY